MTEYLTMLPLTLAFVSQMMATWAYYKEYEWHFFAYTSLMVLAWVGLA